MPANVVMNWFLNILKPTESIAVWILAVVMAWNSYQLSEISKTLGDSAYKAATDYSFNVIEYGFADVSEESEIINLVEKWHADKWGAQIGAIKTICDYTPNRLTELVIDKTAISLCRIVR